MRPGEDFTVIEEFAIQWADGSLVKDWMTGDDWIFRSQEAANNQLGVERRSALILNRPNRANPKVVRRQRTIGAWKEAK